LGLSGEIVAADNLIPARERTRRAVDGEQSRRRCYTHETPAQQPLGPGRRNGHPKSNAAVRGECRHPINSGLPGRNLVIPRKNANRSGVRKHDRHAPAGVGEPGRANPLPSSNENAHFACGYARDRTRWESFITPNHFIWFEVGRVETFCANSGSPIKTWRSTTSASFAVVDARMPVYKACRALR